MFRNMKGGSGGLDPSAPQKFIPLHDLVPSSVKNKVSKTKKSEQTGSGRVHKRKTTKRKKRHSHSSGSRVHIKQYGGGKKKKKTTKKKRKCVKKR